MNDPDQKIRNVALWAIELSSMHRDTWIYTKLDTIHEQIKEPANLQPGELPIVSFFLSETSWYVMTSRRILGQYEDRKINLAIGIDYRERFNNPKGYRPGPLKHETFAEIEISTWRLRIPGSKKATLQFEAGYACMAPIHFFKFLELKYPILDKLRFDPRLPPEDA